MSSKQRDAVARYLERIDDPAVMRHGGCHGADRDFHAILLTQLGVASAIEIYPSDASQDRWARHARGPVIVMGIQPTLVRNKRMVTDAHHLLATPGSTEVLRSGTWATVRYGVEAHCLVYIVYPDGTTEWR